jgi:hypothetical protein
VTKTLESSQNVSVDFATSNVTATAGSDYTGNSNTLTFIAGGALTQTITVVVAGDQIDEANETFNVTLSNPTGGATISDATGVGTINDDDTAGISVSGISGPTTEVGGQATFTIVLSSEPTANVTVGLSTNDPTEGTVSPAPIFTNANWNTPQTVTVTGADDDVDDGNVAYAIVTAQATSTDPLYAVIDPSDVAVTNNDDDANGFTISESGGTTSVIEATGADEVFVVLSAEPIGTVVFNVASGDTGEFTVDTSSLTFDSTDWDVPKIVNIAGQIDGMDDGDQSIPLTISVNDAMSDDAWDSLGDQSVTVTVVDIE